MQLTAKTPLRVSSIDLLRGIVMIIMALDHTRDYFHHYSFLHNPADVNFTTGTIFFTRWITHYCAPVFVFLAGTSAFLSGQKKSKKELSIFLLKRGVWLMVLEVTVVGFGWFFNPLFSITALQVIWVLGFCMITLAALIHLPWRAIFAIGIIMIAGHNLLDGVHVPGNTPAAFGWSLLHEFNAFTLRDAIVVAAYPLIPWMGVMALGYCFGQLYVQSFDPARRRKMLMWMGTAGIALFIVIRLTNVYGDPSKWSSQSSTVYTLISFLNVTKYPPSLLYLLMTLSPAFLFLSVTENVGGWFSKVLSTYGRVPLFYYLLHIYLLHVLAGIVAQLTGFGWQKMIIKHSWITDDPALKGYGLSLPWVYLIWIAVVIALFPLCKAYDRYKQQNKSKWWLSYL